MASFKLRQFTAAALTTSAQDLTPEVTSEASPQIPQEKEISPLRQETHACSSQSLVLIQAALAIKPSIIRAVSKGCSSPTSCPHPWPCPVTRCTHLYQGRAKPRDRRWNHYSRKMPSSLTNCLLRSLTGCSKACIVTYSLLTAPIPFKHNSSHPHVRIVTGQLQSNPSL